MRYLVFSLLAIAVVSAASEVEESVRQCEPGKAFKYYCNLCSCMDNGRDAACTKMFCPPGEYNEDGSRTDGTVVKTSGVGNKNDDSVVCEPGRIFKKFCNTCRCSSDGKLYGCTYMACPPGLYNEDGSLRDFSREKRQTEDKRVCEPGRTFKMYCNSCRCSSDGKFYGCTYMACPPGLYNEDGSLKDFSREKRQTEKERACEPGKLFKQSCNTCKCSKDGTMATCTLMQCDK